MTPRERELLALRYVGRQQRLLDIAEGRTVINEPDAVEAALVQEQEEILFRLKSIPGETR